MKIMHLLKHGQRGNGNVHVAVDLACEQASMGHDVTFVAARCSFADLMRDSGVRVEELPEATSLRRAPAAGVALARLLARRRPDIVNAHMMSSAALAYPLTKLLGIRLVTTMHNSFDGHSGLMRLGSVVIAVSEAERTLLLERGYSPNRVVTVVNGADGSPREALHSKPLAVHEPCVMTLSGLHPRKAVDDVIRAFALVSKDHPEWNLNIVGAGPDARRLRDLVVELGLQETVHMLGFSDAPRPLLDAAQIFATATLADPCPLTVMEARAAGCAIVGTHVGGIPETLEQGAAGRLVPVRDPDAMADVLRGWMSDDELLREWQARAAAGSEFFHVARMASDHVAVYESVVRRGPVHRPRGVPSS